MKKNKIDIEILKDDIDYILDNFDFERVKIVMDCLEWYWFDLDEVPSIGHLRKTARELLKEVLTKGIKNNKDFFQSTGGFEVKYFKSDNLLELSFVVEDYSNIDLIEEREGKECQKK